ncbi:hypothetical protein PVAP13_J683342 [Panicum virgatum]|nr:hypothetical protein PVAP13_J683342 [Panicum virgatum]
MVRAAVSAILKILANKLAPLMMKQYSSIDVDDIVDEFHLEAEKHEAEVANNIVSKCLCTKPKSYLFQFKAALKIKAIKKRFDAIVKQRTDFSATVNSLPEGHPVPHMNRTARAIPTVPNVAVASIICGSEREKHEIISKLVDKNNQQIIKIVSIIGLGGSRKTALSNLVFGDGNTVKDHFEVRIWLMMKMFEAITYKKSEHHSIQNIIQTIADTLTGKRYLLVLDDVWTVGRSQWEDFMLYIKRGAPGSSILLTSRNRNVAEAVESTDLLKLLSLSKDDSWTVFTQIIGEDIKGLDSELLEVGREIVNKCGGVPLAIKVLANVLRGKTRIEQWKAVRDSNLLDAEDKEHRVLASLMLSYSHLPSHLKRCFTICSLFPKGLPLDKQQLVDQWIAHNDVGDECFNSLVQVSFLQDVKEYFGRFILDEQISTNVPKDATSSTKYHKYFSLVQQPKKPLPRMFFKNARAIYAKNAKHLCSIIANNNLSTTMLTAIFQTKHLKYLEMSRLQCESLPETMSDIWSLQALHLECSSLLETLNLSWCMKLKFLPDSIGDCNMLSSIYLCQYMELAALPNSIDHTKIKELPVVITKLRNLQCLSLRNCYRLVELPKGIGNLDKLQVLNLEYCVQLVELPKDINNLEKLHVLNLENCGELFAGISELANVGRNSEGLIIRGISHVLEKDDAHKACLKEKTNLQRLKLEWKMHQKGEVNTEFFFNEKVDTMLEEAVLDGLEPPAGIKELEICGYSGEKYAWWMHNQVVGTEVKGQACFQFLRAMKLSDFQGLKHLQGLVELPCLEELELHKMPSLESISCGPFPSLVKLLMDDLPRLEEVWLVAERTMSDGEEGGNCSNCAPHSGQVRVGNCLTCLNISNCLTLKIKTFLPLSCHLKHWKFSDHLQNTGREWEVVQHMTAWELLKTFLIDNALGELRYPQELNILNCCRLSSLPQAMGQLTSLQVLRIGMCDGLKQLPECLGELCSLRTLHVEWLPKIKSLPQSLQHQHLTSLEDLRIHACHALHELPEWLGDLCALCKLHISGLDGLACFPESMCRLTSLKELCIDSCPLITSFPQGMESLASLEKLCISRLGGIGSLPEGIKGFTALKKLEIIDYQGIKSLPEGIKCLTTLKKLVIKKCPDLARRYEEGKGKDWHPISHIPDVRID